MDTRRGLIALAIVGFTTSATAVGSWSLNFGLFRDNQLRAHSQQLFGVGKPLEASSTEDIGGVLAEADPRKLVTLAGGLRVDVLSAQASLGTQRRHDGVVARRFKPDASDSLQRGGRS
jgi:hypothetical protein